MKSSSYRRKMWQVAVLAVAGVAFLGYLKVGLLPGRLKSVAERRLDALFKDKVRFDRVVYLPFRGISIDGMSATRTDGIQVFKTERLVLKVPLLVFLIDKRIVIARATLEKPMLTFEPPKETRAVPPPGIYPAVRAPGAEEEITGDSPFERHVDLVATLFDEGIEALLPENVYLEELMIRDGRLNIRGTGPSVPETVNALNLRVTFKKQPLIPVKGSFQFGTPAHTKVLFRGRWDMNEKSHELHVTGATRKTPEWLKRFLARQHIALDRLESDFEIHLIPRRPDFYTFTAATRKTVTRLAWKGHGLEGATSFRIAGTWDSAAKRTAFSDGALTLIGATLKGLPQPVNSLAAVYGRLDFDANTMRFESLRALWNGAAILLTGKFLLASPGEFHLEAAMRPASLAFLTPLLPGGKFDLSKLRGDFDIRAQFDGDAEHPGEMRKEIRVGFADASWTVPVLGRELTEGRGAVRLKDDDIRLENITFTTDENRFDLGGNIGLAPAIPSSISLSGAGVSAGARFALGRERADIDELDLVWGKSRGRFHGTLGYAAPNPLELEGDAALDLADITARFGAKSPALAGLKPRGQARIHSRVRSDLAAKDGANWSYTAEIPALKLFDKPTLQNVVLDMSHDGRRTAVTYGKAALYGGEIRFSGEVLASGTPHPPFTVRLTAMDVDLSKSTRDFESLDKEFSGLLNIDAEMKGIFGHNETWSGGGSFDVKHGRLFSTPLFKRLKNLMFVTIEGMDNVTFSQAQGTFKVGSNKIHTEDTVLSSTLINIGLKGDILLDQSLDLVLRSRFTPELINESYELGGFAPLIVNYAEDKITVYTVTGTLSKPVYTEQKTAI